MEGGSARPSAQHQRPRQQEYSNSQPPQAPVRQTKVKPLIPSKEKNAASRALDLSYKAKKVEGARGTPLTALPNDFKATSEELRKLDLSGQTTLSLTALSPIRFTGETLTWLNLSGVQCGEGQPKDWLWLRMMKQLLVLNISHCGLEELPKDISSPTTLKALVASHNVLTSASLSHLASLTELNSLILSDNKLTSLPSALSGMKGLTKLSLANNELRSDGLPDFSPLSALEECRLNGNSGITSIPAGLDALPALSTLELSSTGIASWAEVEKLKAMPALTSLGLKGTPLALQGGERYQDKVKELLPGLRILDNQRFDQKYLERKERLKARSNGGEETAKGVEGTIGDKWKRAYRAEGAASKGKDGKGEKASQVKLGKRKARDQDDKTARAESDAPVADSPKSTAANAAPEKEEDLPMVLSDDEENAAPALNATGPPKKKRSRVKKRLEKQEAKEAGIELQSEQAPRKRQQPKQAKSVGGSLSAPAPAQAEEDDAASSARELLATADPKTEEGARLPDVAKERSGVAKIIEAAPQQARSSKKAKLAHPAKIKEAAADVIALLTREREAASAPRGWD